MLITYMAPASWKSDLAAGAASAQGEKVAPTAESGQKIDEAMQLKRTIHNMVKIAIKGNAPALAARHSAATVEKLPSGPTPPTPQVGSNSKACDPTAGLTHSPKVVTQENNLWPYEICDRVAANSHVL